MHAYQLTSTVLLRTADCLCTIFAAKTLLKKLLQTSVIACPGSVCNNSSFFCVRIHNRIFFFAFRCFVMVLVYKGNGYVTIHKLHLVLHIYLPTCTWLKKARN